MPDYLFEYFKLLKCEYYEEDLVNYMSFTCLSMKPSLRFLGVGPRWPESFVGLGVSAHPESMTVEALSTLFWGLGRSWLCPNRRLARSAHQKPAQHIPLHGISYSLCAPWYVILLSHVNLGSCVRLCLTNYLKMAAFVRLCV